MRMRWMVAGRWVVLFAIMGRGSASFTGRPAARAPSAASTVSARRNSLPPKPPPMKGESSRRFFGSMLRALAMSRLPQPIIWFEVHSVSLSPAHAAMVACGSIIAWLSSGVV